MPHDVLEAASRRSSATRRSQRWASFSVESSTRGAVRGRQLRGSSWAVAGGDPGGGAEPAEAARRVTATEAATAFRPQQQRGPRRRRPVQGVHEGGDAARISSIARAVLSGTTVVRHSSAAFRPGSGHAPTRARARDPALCLAPRAGLEPATRGLEGRRSIQLSYRGGCVSVGVRAACDESAAAAAANRRAAEEEEPDLERGGGDQQP